MALLADFYPDRKKFASPAHRTLKLWDGATSEKLLRFEGYSSTDCQPCFTRDGEPSPHSTLVVPSLVPRKFLVNDRERATHGGAGSEPKPHTLNLKEVGLA